MQGARVLVIAEAGVNHDGSLDKAIALVDSAVTSGADAVKFQTFDAKQLVARSATKAPYQLRNTQMDESQLQMLKRLELSADDHRQLFDYCRSEGIEFMSTGFDKSSIDFLVALGVRRLKVPSGEVTNLPYLRHVSALGLPILLSTGTATMTEVRTAVSAMTEAGIDQSELTVLQCTSSYPAPYEDANLRAMSAMGVALGAAVGLSDHTLGIEASLAAVALGASVIEKHLTLDTAAVGPDHAASLDPEEFRALVTGIRRVEMALGDGTKTPRPSEVPNLLPIRRSIVAARPIQKGEILTESNITTKRPGTGMSPMLWDSVIGSTANRDYELDEEID